MSSYNVKLEILQSDIASSLLNVEELFQEDLRGLSSEEESTLRRIAKLAPIGVSELGEEFKHEIVQSLVHTRLVVRVGHKYDIYWDIFRDYLNSGLIPIQDNYLLRVEVGSVVKAVKLLAEANSILTIPDFQVQTGLSEKSFYNIIHDMRLIGLAKMEGDKVKLQVSFPPSSIEDFDTVLKSYLRDKLRRNRLVWQIIEQLESNSALTLEEVSDILASSSPYTSASKKTWRVYARTFSNWMDTAELAIFNSSNGKLNRYKTGTQVRERRTFPMRRRSNMLMPLTQYTPIEKVVVKLVEALQKDNRVDWTGIGIKKSTLQKALASLEAVGFIRRTSQSIEVLPRGKDFVANPEMRAKLFAESALQIHSFSTFIDILREWKDIRWATDQLAAELRKRLGADWKDVTANVYTKVMLDWARHTSLAPDIFVKRVYERKKYEGYQSSLF